jgi:hypothetical protein
MRECDKRVDYTIYGRTLAHDHGRLAFKMLSRPIVGAVPASRRTGERLSIRAALFWVASASLLLWSAVIATVVRGFGLL